VTVASALPLLLPLAAASSAFLPFLAPTASSHVKPAAAKSVTGRLATEWFEFAPSTTLNDWGSQ